MWFHSQTWHAIKLLHLATKCNFIVEGEKEHFVGFKKGMLKTPMEADRRKIL